jgi:hypothetical protein
VLALLFVVVSFRLEEAELDVHDLSGNRFRSGVDIAGVRLHRLCSVDGLAGAEGRSIANWLPLISPNFPPTPLAMP